MTSSRTSQTRPLSYVSATDLPQPSAQNIPQWKEHINRLHARTKDVQNKLAQIPEQFQQGALTAFVIAIILGCLYLITLLYTSPTCVHFVNVLLRVATEMLWLLLSWGIVAAICYYALTYLGGASSEDAQKSSGLSGSSASANCEWTNEFLAWMYNNFHKVPGPMDAWIRSLNEIAKKVTSPAKCEVLFESFGDHSNVVRPPRITDIKAVKGPRDHITIYSNVHFPCIKLKLVSSQRVGDRLVVCNLDGSIIDLRGEVECRVACIANQFYVVVCFKGRPEMDIELSYSDPNTQHQAISFGLVEESIRRCLLSAVTHINLSDCWPAVNFEEDQRITDNFSRVNNAQVFSSMYSNSMERKRDNLYENYAQPVNRRSAEKPAVDMFNMSKLNEGLNGSFDRQKPMTSGYTANDYDHVTADDSFGTRIDDGRGGNQNEVTDMFKKLNDTHLASPMINSNTVPNKLRVKVIKANRLERNDKIAVQQPYVDIEMDEPSQKHSTSKGINANPYWEETFAFDLTPASEEILFELHDASCQKSVTKENQQDERFLGLCLVNFEEIRRSGEQLHVLKLQGTPYKKDEITGELTVQFDFYYDPTSTTIGKYIDTVKIRDKGGNEFRETVTVQRRALYDPHDNFDVNDITPVKTTTVMVKTVSQQLKEKPHIQSVHGSMENAIDPTTQRILEEQIRNSNDPKLQQLEAKLQKVESLRQSKAEEDRMARSYSIGADGQPNQNLDNRGRDRTKKNGHVSGEKRERSFFGELRDRLSGRKKSQKRSKSMDVGGPEIEEAVSLPPSRDVSRTRYAVSTSGSYLETQSVGGLSGESTKSLYQHSTLILEVEEEKGKKYFLIPPSILSEPAAARLMKKGRKLHIYNDHTFVAVKIRGGINCHVCQNRIKSSFSKQAYQCRDCKLVCHKSCHYKTDAFCTKSTVSKLQIAKDIDWAHFLSHYQLEEFISLEGV